MRLSDLGPFHVDRTQEYDNCPFEKSYCEMISVRGSKSEPGYSIPSHVFRYSDSELALYLKDKKNKWIQLSKIANQNVDLRDDEIIIIFPMAKFPEISKAIPLVRKRGKLDLSEDEKRERADRLNHARKMKQNEPIKIERGHCHIPRPTLGDFQ